MVQQQHRYELVGSGSSSSSSSNRQQQQQQQQQQHQYYRSARSWFFVSALAGIVFFLGWVTVEEGSWSLVVAPAMESPNHQPSSLLLRNPSTTTKPGIVDDQTDAAITGSAFAGGDDDDDAASSADDETDGSTMTGTTPAKNDASSATSRVVGDDTTIVLDDDDGEEMLSVLEEEDDDDDDTERNDTPPGATTTTTMGDEEEERPDVAWIVSFGGSGTSYTILNIESITGQSTASNYAQDYKDLIPVQEYYEHGPYVRSPHKPLPPKFILTKTHCGGYCMDCPPTTYVYETAYEFQEACRTAHILDVNGVLVQQVYNATIPKRAVHLVRSPFDNLVGRFHLSVRRQEKRSGINATELDQAFPDTAEGLQNWCQYLDDKYVEPESHYEVLKQYKDVPCHAEWFRYIQWHNLADTVLRDLDIPVHYLWYHNYTSGYNQTVDHLLDFLSLQRHDAPYPWYAGHSYRSFFPPNMTIAAISMMKDLASANTWRLIKDYIAEYTDMEMLYNTPDEVVVDEEKTDSSTEDDDIVDEEPKVTSTVVVEQMSNDPDPQVVWLLSFPNSGTSYTIMNVEKMANVTTGTTYARDLDGAIAMTPHGPFLHRQDKRTPHYVLTKTHCAGFCNQCKPNGYKPSSDPYHFTQACTRVERPGSKPGQDDYFPEYLPVKAVHLFRDPFDNIVSRMHLEVEKEQADFATSKAGLANYCSYLDGMFTLEERQAFDETTHKLFRNVPCHADFYRYTVWHNQALEMTERLNLPVHYLHYEEYSNSYDDATSRLLDFLNLTAVAKPVVFQTGKVYRYLWDDSLESVQALVQHVASPATWAHIRRYFED